MSSRVDWVRHYDVKSVVIINEFPYEAHWSEYRINGTSRLGYYTQAAIYLCTVDDVAYVIVRDLTPHSMYLMQRIRRRARAHRVIAIILSSDADGMITEYQIFDDYGDTPAIDNILDIIKKYAHDDISICSYNIIFPDLCSRVKKFLVMQLSERTIQLILRVIDAIGTSRTQQIAE